jgi:hypothetical protein
VWVNAKKRSSGVIDDALSQAWPESRGPERLTTRWTSRCFPITADELAPCEMPETIIFDHLGLSPSRK